METFWQDVRYAARTLLKSPGFTLIAVLTMALGIGVNTALFSVVNGVLLSPLPYPRPDRLVALYTKTANFSQSSVSYPNFLDWQKNNRSFESLTARRTDDFNATGEGAAERVRALMISAGFFEALGVKPLAGRTFSAGEDAPGAAPVVLISEGLWKRRYGSAEVLGRTLELSGTAHAILGVIPSSFRLARNCDVYVPIGQWTDETFRDRRVGMGMRVLGRLKPGRTLEQAQADMDAVAAGLARDYPEADAKTGITLVPLKKDMVGDIQPFLLLLAGAVGFVQLIACANVANLLLARSSKRSREFAIRAALGASRGRVIRQLLTESVLLSSMGGALGLLAASWGTGEALALLPDALPRSGDVGLDGGVLLFALGISVLSGVFFGLAPALKALRPDLRETLHEGGRGASGVRHRAQSFLVAAEMALALVLLIGAGLMIRSLASVWSVDPGFDPRHVLTLNVAFAPDMAAKPPEEVRRMMRDLEARMTAVPGVESVTTNGGSLPMDGDSELPFWIEGQPKPASDNDMSWSLFYLVDPPYLQAMGIPLKRGRFIGEHDDIHAPMVAVIDEVFARKFFPREDPLGKRLNVGLLGQAEIVGVVGHVKHWGLESDGQQTIQAQFYFPFQQLPDKFMPLAVKGGTFVVRSQQAPRALEEQIRKTIAQADPRQAVYGVRTMEEIVSDSLAARRFSTLLLDAFAAMALLLSTVGVYSVISYVIGQRTQELGVRVALGAQRGDLLRLVLGQGARMALAGVLVGVGAALGLTRLMSKMLFGVSATDPMTFGGVAVLLVGVALAACYLPARRATRVDPMVALRCE